MYILHNVFYFLDLSSILASIIYNIYKKHFDNWFLVGLPIFCALLICPIATILKIRIFFQKKNPLKEEADLYNSLYYFISLFEISLQTLPSLFIQIKYDTNVYLQASRLITAVLYICMAVARFFVWRKRHFSTPGLYINTIAFELMFSLYIAHRLIILLLLWQKNTATFVFITIIHMLFGLCHSLDEWSHGPFGNGNILSKTERNVLNGLTFTVVYPITHVFFYLKILKPQKWWALFFYTTVFFEHIIIIFLYFNKTTIISAVMAALAFLSYSTHIFYNSYYSDVPILRQGQGQGQQQEPEELAKKYMYLAY